MSDSKIGCGVVVQTLDAVEVVTKLAQGMRTRKRMSTKKIFAYSLCCNALLLTEEYREVLAIPSAKVPIVKFVHVAR